MILVVDSDGNFYPVEQIEVQEPWHVQEPSVGAGEIRPSNIIDKTFTIERERAVSKDKYWTVDKTNTFTVTVSKPKTVEREILDIVIVYEGTITKEKLIGVQGASSEITVTREITREVDYTNFTEFA